MSSDLKAEAERLLKETPDITEQERAYLEEVIAGKHSILAWRNTFNAGAPAHMIPVGGKVATILRDSDTVVIGPGVWEPHEVRSVLDHAFEALSPDKP